MCASRLHLRRLTAGVGERLVDDLPRTTDLSEREEVRKGHGAPEAFLLNDRERRIADLLDRGSGLDTGALGSTMR
jgi:hypothetical protein